MAGVGYERVFVILLLLLLVAVIEAKQDEHIHWRAQRARGRGV